MNIFDYAKKIKNMFGKNALISEIDSARDILSNHVIPTLDKNLPFFVTNESKLMSNRYRRERSEIIKGFAASGHLQMSNPFTMLKASMTNAVSILDFIERWLDKNTPEEQLNGQTITLPKANLLQLLDSITFASNYTLTWLNAVLSAESNLINGIGEDIQLTPDTIRYLGEQQTPWIKTVSLLATPVKQIETLVDAIPLVVMAEANPKGLVATQGNKIDPFRFGFIQSNANPIWLAGILLSDYQAKRYKALKTMKETIELRTHRLKDQLNDKNGDNPRLASIIKNYEGQLDNINGQLRKQEKKFYADAH